MTTVVDATQELATHLGLPVGLPHQFTKMHIAKAMQINWCYNFEATKREQTHWKNTACLQGDFVFHGVTFAFKMLIDKNRSALDHDKIGTQLYEFRRIAGPAPQTKQCKEAKAWIDTLYVLAIVRHIMLDLHWYQGDYPEVSQCWVFAPMNGQRGDTPINYEPEYFGEFCYTREQAVANAILLSPYIGACMVVELDSGKVIRNESVWADSLMSFQPHRRIWMKALTDVAHFINKKGSELFL